MAAYENASGATFVLPDGSEVQDGATVDIADDVAGIPGVLQMIEGGKLVKVKGRAKPTQEG